MKVRNKRALPEETCVDTGDLALTRAAALGDPKAQRRLLERLFERVRRTMSYMAGGGADAEDLAQTALIQILSSAGSFRGDASLAYWADRVALQTAAKHFARRKRRKYIRESRFPAPPVAPSAVDETAERLRAKQRLAELLAMLSEKNRTALTLHYVLGYSIAEMATLCDCPINTIRGRLRQGRKQLKKLVSKDPLLSQWGTGIKW
ncbi:MAG: RNA polymerase sigma factor [Myxococcota bacterium]|nr:RNA polymerase sigma factor [Myxococcota bacterium]